MAGERILIADDSRENREFIIDYILRPNSFEPIEARDGMEAMQIIRAQNPDLILLDLQMPRLDGRGVLEALRRETLNIPVVLMTFHGSEEIAVEVFRLGVRDYVKKPYTPEEMLAAIESSLTETRLRKEKDALTSRLLMANRDLHNRVKELNTLYTIGKSVTSVLNPPQLLARIVEAAASMTAAEQGRIVLVEGNQLIVRAVKRRADQQARATGDLAINPAIENAINTGKAVMLSPQETTLIRQRIPNSPTAILAVPMLYNQRVIGAISVEMEVSTTRIFKDHDAALLSALSDYAAIAIENARNYADLEATKDRETSTIRAAFERFVAPTVVDRILRNPDGLQLGGDRREISVLFADIRGYTTFAENTDPAHVVAMLNDYFAVATDVIFNREGTLDKFMGDAVMAIFNAPGLQPDHPRRAVECALALQDTIKEINSWRGDRALTFGIGVTMGDAIVGNVGTPRAMNYTAIGDVVNLAKRLQELAEPGQVLVEEALIQRIGPTQADRLGSVQIKGRKHNAVIYNVRSLS